MQFISSARQLAVACGLFWAASSIGCGGGSSSNAPVAVNPSPAAAPAAAPTVAPAEAVGGGSEEASMSTDEASAMPGEAAYNSAPGDASMEAYAGMSPEYDPNMSMSGMGSGMGMEGMNGMGMAGMGMGMNGMSGRPALVDPAPTEDEDYLTKAKYAFAIGKESVAEQYFVAQVLAHGEEAEDLLTQVRWSPGARRPATVVRFAVGIDLEAPATAQNLQPIGRLQAGNNPGGGSGAEYGMESGSGGPAGQNAGAGGRTLGDITGNFGQELITAFETQWNNGDFGTVFKEVRTIVPMVRPTPGAQFGMGGSSYDPSMGSSMMGNEGSGGMMGSEGMPGGAAAPADAALRLKATPGKIIVPGLTYLGTGTQAELATKAQEQGIDYLFLFDVNVKIQRMISNDTRLRLVNVKDGSSIMTTSMLNNFKVEREMAMKGETDIVAKEVAKIFRKIEPFKLADLPKLEPAHAQARVKSLIEKDPKNALPILLEARLFNSLGLLDNEQRDAAYQLVLGGSGIAFISGTLEDREAVLKPLLEPYK